MFVNLGKKFMNFEKDCKFNKNHGYEKKFVNSNRCSHILKNFKINSQISNYLRIQKKFTNLSNVSGAQIRKMFTNSEK